MLNAYVYIDMDSITFNHRHIDSGPELFRAKREWGKQDELSTILLQRSWRKNKEYFW